MDGLERPCARCAGGDHACAGGLCGCLADHAGDTSILRGFKRVKRLMHPEREAWVKGGWVAARSAGR